MRVCCEWPLAARLGRCQRNAKPRLLVGARRLLTPRYRWGQAIFCQQVEGRASVPPTSSAGLVSVLQLPGCGWSGCLESIGALRFGKDALCRRQKQKLQKRQKNWYGWLTSGTLGARHQPARSAGSAARDLTADLATELGWVLKLGADARRM